MEFYKKELCVIEKWTEKIHCSTGDKVFDKYLENKYINYTSFNDEYDMFSSNNLINFIEHWQYLINGYFPGNTKTKLAIADVYIYNGYVLCIDKTYLIVRIQKRWKNYYRKKIKNNINPLRIIYREIHGRFPR